MVKLESFWQLDRKSFKFCKQDLLALLFINLANTFKLYRSEVWKATHTLHFSTILRKTKCSVHNVNWAVYGTSIWRSWVQWKGFFHARSIKDYVHMWKDVFQLFCTVFCKVGYGISIKYKYSRNICCVEKGCSWHRK